MDPVHTETFPKRDIMKCKEIISQLEYGGEDRNKSKGLKPLIREEVILKDNKVSKTKRNQTLSAIESHTHIDNPFLKYPEVIDPFKKGLVDLFHLEIQGTFRTQLKKTLEKTLENILEVWMTLNLHALILVFQMELK